jgi:hypothetical protein
MPICFPRGVNEEQECTVICNTGGTYTFIVPAGTFIAASLAEANAIAESYACNQTFANRLCVGTLTLDNTLCVGDEFDDTVEIDGAERDLVYTIDSGTLPSGLELVGLEMSFQITGTPDTPGVYTFTVRATDMDGNYAEKEYSLTVIGCGRITEEEEDRLTEEGEYRITEDQ